MDVNVFVNAVTQIMACINAQPNALSCLVTVKETLEGTMETLSVYEK